MEKQSERGLDVFPNQAALHYFNGCAKGQLGKHQQAVEALDQALIMSGRNARLKFDVLTRLGTEHCALKNYESATKNFEEALKLNANDPELLCAYALCLADRPDQLAKAKEMATLANDLAPNRPSLLDAYGMVLYKAKEFAMAKEWLSKALQNGGDKKAATLEHFGDALYQLGQTNEAVQYWQRASDKSGGNSPALLKKIADRQLTE
jgi:tetratricopeptide (TPR) repeat protein